MPVLPGKSGCLADAARLELIVEELYVNTITHGQCADGSSAVDILLRRDANGIHLRYSDAAAPFDLAASPSPTTNLPSVVFGITLIHGLCRHVSPAMSTGETSTNWSCKAPG